MFIGLLSFFISREGDIGPSTHFLIGSSIDIDDVPLRVDALSKFLELFSKGSRVFLSLVIDSLNVKNI